MAPQPYIEDDISLDDSPVIVELRPRRNSSAEGGGQAGGDPLARYGDRMVVMAREKAREGARERGRDRSREGRRDRGTPPKAGAGHNPFYPGHLLITNFQLIFIPSHHLTPSATPQPGAALLPIIQLPLLAIWRLSPVTFEQKDLAVVSIRSKDFRRVHLLFTGLLRKGRWNAFRNALTTIEFYASPPPENGWTGIFAFKTKGRNQQADSPPDATHAASTVNGTAPHASTPSHVLTHPAPKQSRAFSVAVPSPQLRAEAVSPPRPTKASTAVSSPRNLYGKRDGETDDEEDIANLSAVLAVEGGPVVLGDSPRVPSSTSGTDTEDEEAANTTLVHHSLASALKVDTSAAGDALPPPLTVVAVAGAAVVSPLASFSFSQRMEGWDLYDPYAEYARMGVPSRHWRISSANQGYTLCSSYPSVLVVPMRSSDQDLLQARAFRSRHRLPVFVWRRRREGDEGRGAVLLRSSQPMVGLMNARSAEDELLLSHAVSSNPQAALVIVDARPVANARANLALGAGTELPENYQSTAVAECRVEYLGIENIHVMRKSYKALWKLAVKMMEDEGAGVGGAVQFWPEFIATHHFTHLSAVIAGAALVASTLSSPTAPTVLLHCSDGWDRTTQVSSLALLLLDAHYRTLGGFVALVEKEWLSFGHKFTDRTALGLTGSAQEEAPIFHQFIDCVYQLMRQHETAFEFTADLLIFVLDSLYSGRWGTFLGNSELERVKAGVAQRSGSVWGEVMGRWAEGEWVQDGYERVEAVLPVDVRLMGFWKEYYLRWDMARGEPGMAGEGRKGRGRRGRGEEEEEEEVVKGVVEGMVVEVAWEWERQAGEEKGRRIAELEAQLRALSKKNGVTSGSNGR